MTDVSIAPTATTRAVNIIKAALKSSLLTKMAATTVCVWSRKLHIVETGGLLLARCGGLVGYSWVLVVVGETNLFLLPSSPPPPPLHFIG